MIEGEDVRIRESWGDLGSWGLVIEGGAYMTYLR